MKRRNPSPLELLLLAPWWASLVVGAVAFSGLRFVLPAVSAGKGPVIEGLALGAQPFAPYALAFFALISILSAVFGAKRRALVDRQTSLESLRSTPWKHFEFMVGEAFRREGYQIEETLGGGADGGVDLVLRRNGARYLVQCKQWQQRSFGVQVVREQFGILAAEDAAEAIIVISGVFTPDAREFAAGKPIRLIDGLELLNLIKSVQNPASTNRGATKSQSENASRAKTPACPLCGEPMVLRTSRRGTNAGSQFWGCTNFPRCRGTRPS